MSIMVFFVLTQDSEVLRLMEDEDWLPILTQHREKIMVSLFDKLVFTTIMLTSLLIEFESF